MRAFNFAAGPSTLPLPVLEQVRAELTDWRGTGMSVMEVSHRSRAFADVAEALESDLRALLDIPSHYEVLFLQGGGMAQFSAVPLNLAPTGAHVDNVNTGAWSAKAIAEARRYAQVQVVADESPSGYTTVPAPGQIQPTAGSAYLHYCPNETIGGVEFPYIPEVGATPLVADFSSTILSRPLPVGRFGLIYAGAQKNLGPAGLTVVVVREDLLGRARPGTPPVLDYTVMAAEGSMINTPPTFSWYVASLVLKWIRAGGGLEAMADRNRAKAEALYHAIDASGFYRNPVAPGCRSWMNVPFTLPRPELDAAFLAEAQARGLTNLKGHRSVGGMRASIYNAMPLEGVQALIAFMQDFQRRHG